MMWGDGWMGWFGWFAMVAWWTVLLVAMVWVVRGARRPDSARDRLDERLATGELTIEQYRERRQALR